MIKKKTVRDIDVKGKRVLVRVDFNVPLERQAAGPRPKSSLKILDDTRIRASLPTIEHLMGRGAKVILMSHLGRPKGVDEHLRLDLVAKRLQELLRKRVRYASDCIGSEVEEAIRVMAPGDVLLLENLRFHPEEEKNDSEFAKRLAGLADVYVNDAFATAHRAHASTEGVAHHLPAVAGFLMEKELKFLGEALQKPRRPFLAILGGAKISDKIGVIRNLLPKVDAMLIGGGLANTFLAAKGLSVGESLVEQESINVAKELLEAAGDKLTLPMDAVVADAFSKDAQSHVVPVDDIPKGRRIMDIGPKTIDLFKGKLAGVKTVVWNGPLGVFEFPKFARGTFAVAKALASLKATTIIGGGESVAAVEKAGVADKITHISTGGGASLEFLEGKTLPGVAVLDELV